MRIAMVAPLEIRTPPVKYGGTELVVSILTEELVRLGHKVTLFASGDSLTSAELVSASSEFLRKSEKSSPALSLLNVSLCLDMADNFDIIHNHTTFEGPALAGLVKTPMLSTIHGCLDGDSLTIFRHYKGWYNTISKSSKSLLPQKERFVGVIYNAVNCSSYHYNAGEHENYLLFLSRLSPEKGPQIAIQVALKLGMRLIIAGNVSPSDRDFFETQISPYVDGRMIKYEGEVDERRKKELFTNAKCLLAPLLWPEPFGLFMVEAMASGTPVVAFNNGAACEVVLHGRTGYVVNSAEEMADAVQRIDEIEPSKCRERVLKRFDAPILVNNYLEAYHRILKEKEKTAAQQPKLITNR